MKKYQRGVALLWALLLCVVLLIITGSMVSIIAKESQTTVRTENSIQAYAAAKTGIDWYLKQREVDNSFIEPVNCTSDPAVGSTINVDTGISAVICKLGSDTIRSTGKTGNSTRSIEYRNQSYNYINVPLAAGPIALPTPIELSEGFELVVKFYPGSSNPYSFNFGLTDSSLNGIIFYNTNINNLSIARKAGAVTSPIASTVVAYPSGIPLGAQDTNPGVYNERDLVTARLRYIRNEFVSVRYEGNYINNNCLVALSGSLNFNFTNPFTQFTLGGVSVMEGDNLRVYTGAYSGVYITSIAYKNF